MIQNQFYCRCVILVSDRRKKGVSGNPSVGTGATFNQELNDTRIGIKKRIKERTVALFIGHVDARSMFQKRTHEL